MFLNVNKLNFAKTKTKTCFSVRIERFCQKEKEKDPKRRRRIGKEGGALKSKSDDNVSTFVEVAR